MSYKIKLAFYKSPKSNYEEFASWKQWMVTAMTQYFTSHKAYDVVLVHVDIILMNSQKYGPEQGKILKAENRTFDRIGFNSFIDIYMDKSDYKKICRFLRREEQDKVGFDYLGLLNFVKFSPTYCIPIVNSHDGIFFKRRWFCSALTSVCLKLTKQFSNNTNFYIQELVNKPHYQTSIMDIYANLQYAGYANTTSLIDDNELDNESKLLHDQVISEIEKEGIFDYDLEEKLREIL
jgi:hypothetical protein